MSTASPWAAIAEARTRPFDDGLTAELLAAARSALQEAGPTGFRVDDIVARCGTSKSAIYRRWGSKDVFLAAAVESFAWDDVHPRGDDPAADLVVLFEHWIYRGEATDAQASRLIRSITRHESSRAAYETSLWPVRRAALSALLEHHGLGAAPEVPESVLRLPQGFIIDSVIARGSDIGRSDIRAFVDEVYLPLLRSAARAAER